MAARSNGCRHYTLGVVGFRTYPVCVTGLSRLPRAIEGFVAAAFSAYLACGCVTTIGYKPTVPHEAKSRDAAFEVNRITATPGPSVIITGQYRLEQNASPGFPSLALSAARPCSGGIAASALGLGTHMLGENVATSGEFFYHFRQDSTLLREPTVLDIPILRRNGAAPTCLRVPIVERRTTPEWTRLPNYSLGMGFQLLVPFRRIYDVSVVPMLAFRGGPWIGPLRLRVALEWGGAAAKTSNPNLIGYAYGAGLLADTLFYSKGVWGLGVAAGYDVTAISFDANVEKLSHQGAGYRGLMHGPRWGLLFELLGDPAVSPAFKRRRDSESITLEIFGAAEWSSDHAVATPGLWFALGGDLGNM